MARLDDLVDQIADPALHGEIKGALAAFKRRQRFGLVFEEHIPETTSLFGLPIYPGCLVQRRDARTAKTLYRVVSVMADDTATIEPINGGDAEMISTHNLLTVKRFGDPMYPALTPLVVRHPSF